MTMSSDQSFTLNNKRKEEKSVKLSNVFRRLTQSKRGLEGEERKECSMTRIAMLPIRSIRLVKVKQKGERW